MTTSMIKTLAAVSTLNGEFMVDFRGSFAHNASGSVDLNTRAFMALVAAKQITVRDCAFYSVAK